MPPLECIGPDMRPAPAAPAPMSRARLALVLTASLALHAGAFAAFQREAPPLASVGIESISVEIVLGTDRPAGLAPTPVESESAVNAAAVRGEALEPLKPETARAEAKLAQAVPQAEAETLSDIAPPEVDSETVPAPKRRTVVQRPKRDRGDDMRTRESRASLASVAASGIGRGRSDISSNYVGLLRAQLARHQRVPPEAERNGDRGTAVVSFIIGPRGTVTRVTLVRGTGHPSLDREALALVQRAAPFPPPPSGMSIRPTVPITVR